MHFGKAQKNQTVSYSRSKYKPKRDFFIASFFKIWQVEKSFFPNTNALISVKFKIWYVDENSIENLTRCIFLSSKNDMPRTIYIKIKPVVVSPT